MPSRIKVIDSRRIGSLYVIRGMFNHILAEKIIVEIAHFVWDKNFITGVGVVDTQHKKLVELINKYGDMLANNNVSSCDMKSVLSELMDYAKYHFCEEEALMYERNIDLRHIQTHQQEHQYFLEEVMLMQGELNNSSIETAQYLQDFLVHWLAYHILGLDQTMARLMKAMDEGVTAEDAFYQEDNVINDARGPLLVALGALFRQVSNRNNSLMALTDRLEQIVKERTYELESANQELDLANRILDEMASTDELTGLSNRRFAMRELNRLWIEAKVEHLSLSCIMIDVDNFKVINDTEGHDCGDKVLVSLAETLLDNIRTDDIVCRLGGDEFLVICPATDKEGVEKVAMDILKSVQKIKLYFNHSHWIGSVSIGVAICNQSMLSATDLIRCADQAMY